MAQYSSDDIATKPIVRTADQDSAGYLNSDFDFILPERIKYFGLSWDASSKWLKASLLNPENEDVQITSYLDGQGVVPSGLDINGPAYDQTTVNYQDQTFFINNSFSSSLNYTTLIILPVTYAPVGILSLIVWLNGVPYQAYNISYRTYLKFTNGSSPLIEGSFMQIVIETLFTNT